MDFPETRKVADKTGLPVAFYQIARVINVLIIIALPFLP